MKDSNTISKFDPPSEHESSIVTLEQTNGDVHQYQYHSRQPFKEDGIYRPLQAFKYIFVCGNPDCGGFVELYKPSYLGKNQNHRQDSVSYAIESTVIVHGPWLIETYWFCRFKLDA